MALIVLAHHLDATKPWRQVLLGTEIPMTVSQARGQARGFALSEGDQFITLFMKMNTRGVEELVFPCEDTAEDLLADIPDLRALFARKTKKGLTKDPQAGLNLSAPAGIGGDPQRASAGL